MSNKRKRTSPIWLMPSEEFRELVKNSSSYTEILRHFGTENHGGMARILHQRIKEENIDVSHIEFRKKDHTYLKERVIPLEKILVENSSYNRRCLKERLLKEGLLENKCAICGLEPIWNGKPLVLVLDHINGINNDNRLENLRLLCPNCNSQTETFTGRNIKRSNKKYCTRCGAPISGKGKLGICVSCYALQRRKVERPDKNVLLLQVKELGYMGTARLYGVSDNTIRKWINK